MTQFTGKVALITACLSILSACSDPPGGAPQAGQILSEASQEGANYGVYPVTRETLPLLASWPRHDRARQYGWIKRQSGPSSQVIAPGDVIDLTIWDNGDSSLLMERGQKTVEMKGIRVTPAGEVFLPYVDQVYISNMTPDRARAVVQEKFSAISPTAQVQLLHTPGRESSVDLISGVATPGTFPLPDRDVTVLGLIAMGGGISKDLINPQVRLSRNGKLYGISANKLLDEPTLDTTLAGGDKVYLESDERYFLSLGAANKESQIFFPSDQVTVLDAASLVGGLSATRANAKGVLILREYPSSSVRADETGPKTNRVVFVFDLKSADGLFSAGEFPIQHKDLVLVTESSVVGTATIISLIYEAFGIVIRAEDLT